MSDTDKDGCYCNVCGGIRPDKVTTKRIIVTGKEIGINRLDQIIEEVRMMSLSDDQAVKEELLRRAKVANYIPTARSNDYGIALLAEYKKGA